MWTLTQKITCFATQCARGKIRVERVPEEWRTKGRVLRDASYETLH